MQAASIPSSELQQTDRDGTNVSAMSGDNLYLNMVPVNEHLRLGDQHLPNARQHSREKWEAMKPIIQHLYMDQQHPLDVVVGIMAEEHGFRATNKMYKTRFIRWGWRKNRPRDKQKTIATSTQDQDRTKPSFQHVQHLKAPDMLKDQEDPIAISRNHTMDVSELQRWCSSFTKTNPGPSSRDYASMARYSLAEAAFSDTAVQLGRGKINRAFQSLNKVFDAMIGNEVYLHPRHHTAFWLLCNGVYNACTLVSDSQFHLLRELLCFLARNALASFQKLASASSLFRVRLITALVRMSRDNPGVMTQTFRTAYLATAESLETKLGRKHPVVLITWLDYFWYFDIPVDPTRDLVARYSAALREVDSTTGRESDATISFLHTFTIFLFYCVRDEIQARAALADLLERISCRIADQTSPAPNNLHFQKAYAFASLLQGLLILEDQCDVADCERVVRTAIEWLKHCEGNGAFRHAMLLEADLSALTTAYVEGMDLRSIPLVYAKPKIDNAAARTQNVGSLLSLTATPEQQYTYTLR